MTPYSASAWCRSDELGGAWMSAGGPATEFESPLLDEIERLQADLVASRKQTSRLARKDVTRKLVTATLEKRLARTKQTLMAESARVTRMYAALHSIGQYATQGGYPPGAHWKRDVIGFVNYGFDGPMYKEHLP